MGSEPNVSPEKATCYMKEVNCWCTHGRGLTLMVAYLRDTLQGSHRVDNDQFQAVPPARRCPGARRETCRSGGLFSRESRDLPRPKARAPGFEDTVESWDDSDALICILFRTPEPSYHVRVWEKTSNATPSQPRTISSRKTEILVVDISFIADGIVTTNTNRSTRFVLPWKSIAMGRELEL